MTSSPEGYLKVSPRFSSSTSLWREARVKEKERKRKQGKQRGREREREREKRREKEFSLPGRKARPSFLAPASKTPFRLYSSSTLPESIPLRLHSNRDFFVVAVLRRTSRSGQPANTPSSLSKPWGAAPWITKSRGVAANVREAPLYS